MVYTRKAFHWAGVRARSKGEGWRARGMQLPQHIALCILRETWQLFSRFPADKLYWPQATEKKPRLPEMLPQETCLYSDELPKNLSPRCAQTILSAPPVKCAKSTSNCELPTYLQENWTQSLRMQWQPQRPLFFLVTLMYLYVWNTGKSWQHKHA